MDKELKDHIDVLEDIDSTMGEKEDASKNILKLTLDGVDIEMALPGLKKFYMECHQVPPREPASDAFLIHCIDKGKMEDIEAFLEEVKYPSFVFESIFRVVDKWKKDISSMLSLLINHLPQGRLDHNVHRILMAHLAQAKSGKSSEMKRISELILNHPKSKQKLPFFVQEGAIDKKNMGPAMPAIVNLLSGKSKKLAESAAKAISWAAETGSDLSKVVDEMKTILAGNYGNKERVAGKLTYFFIKKKKWDEIEALASSTEKETRLGAYKVLNARLKRIWRKNPEALSILLGGLLDKVPVVRKRTWAGIDTAEREKVKLIPSNERLLDLIEGLKDEENNEELLGYLYKVASIYDEAANLIIDALKANSFKSCKAASTLQEKIEKFKKGELLSPCSLCQYIPRSKYYYLPSDLPREARKLGLKMPEFEKITSILKCPECGVHYYYEYEQEWEDMSVDTSIILRRMDPSETLKNLKGDERLEYNKRIPQLLEKCWIEVDHPVEFLRAEASWNLARYSIAKGNFDDLKKLLKIKDPIVNDLVFRELSSAGPKKIPVSSFMDIFQDALGRENSGIRHDAANYLTREYVDKNNYEEIMNLLEYDDANVVSAATYIIWISVGNVGFDITPIKGKLKELMKSKTETIRNSSRYAIKEASKASGKPEIDIFLENLNDDNPKIRQEAISALGDLVKKGEDNKRVILEVTKHLTDDENAWLVYDTLERMVHLPDIIVAIPPLIEILEDLDNKDRWKARHILSLCQHRGIDISPAYEVIARNIQSMGEKDQGGDNILRTAMRNDEDLSSIKPYIEPCLKWNLDEYYGESIIYIMTYIYMKERNLERLKFMLEHENTRIPGSTMEKLLKLSGDVAELVPIYAKNLIRGNWYIRNRAAASLKDYGRGGGERLAWVRELVEQLDIKGLNDKRLKDYNEFIEELKKDMNFGT